MTQYHKKTLELLAKSGEEMPTITMEQQEKWRAKEKQLGITLPEAYWDYLVFGGSKIFSDMMGGCTNDIFPDIDVVTLPNNKGKALLFEEEGYESIYYKYCLLDGSDNPPVLFAEHFQKTFTEFSQHFSEAVYVKVVEDKMINGSHWLWVTDLDCLTALENSFSEVVRTEFVVHGDLHRVSIYFETPCGGLVKAEYNKDKTPFDFTENGEVLIVQSFHFDDEAEGEFHKKLYEMIGFENIIPETFDCPHLLEDLIEFLDEALASNRLADIHFACVHEPSKEALEALLKAHKQVSIGKRGAGMAFSWTDYYDKYNTPNIQYIGTEKGYAELGGKEWGVVISIRGDEYDRYVIESIKLWDANSIIVKSERVGKISFPSRILGAIRRRF